MGKTTDNDLLPAGTGPERAPILQARAGPVPAGKKTSPGEPAGDRRDPEVPERPVRRRFSAEYKLHIVRQADACGDQPGRVGELLRREGLYSSHLSTWRKHREQGTLAALSPKKRGRKPGIALRLIPRKGMSTWSAKAVSSKGWNNGACHGRTGLRHCHTSEKEDRQHFHKDQDQGHRFWDAGIGAGSIAARHLAEMQLPDVIVGRRESARRRAIIACV